MQNRTLKMSIHLQRSLLAFDLDAKSERTLCAFNSSGKNERCTQLTFVNARKHQEKHMSTNAERSDGTIKRSVLCNNFLSSKIIDHCERENLDVAKWMAEAVDKAASSNIDIEETQFFGRFRYLKTPHHWHVYFYAKSKSVELVAEVAELSECSKLAVVRAILASELGIEKERYERPSRKK